MLVIAIPVFGQKPHEEGTWRVWLEPKFMRAPVHKPILGAESSELVAGWRSELGDEYFSQGQFDALKVGWEQFLAKALANADADFASLQPQYVRDEKNVIEYAVLRSEVPIVASAVLATSFLHRFKETIGEKVLVAVPSRHTAFVFPTLASNYQEYAAMVFDAYEETAYPVSVEVFEVSAQGWRAVGVYERPVSSTP